MAEKITKDTPLQVGLRFYNQTRGMEGFPCRIVVLTEDTVVYRLGQDGVGVRYSVPRQAFVGARHSVLRTGDVAVPPVRV